MAFPVENGKKEPHNWILYIQISLGTKFHYKQTISNFGIKFIQSIPGQKRNKVNNATECIFKLA